VTDNCPLGALRGRADGNLPRDSLISHLTWHIAMYILTDKSITQCDCLVPCIRFTDFTVMLESCFVSFTIIKNGT